MDNPERLATLGKQDTYRRRQTKTQQNTDPTKTPAIRNYLIEYS